ncbi:type IV pilus twitching motility protein PilT [Filifactor villosus]|uniref:Type IV pilus twitching motility protein PilT n=1 Tax=Filifactor villosus TaxID=29374 RepID=A0ABV9QNA9_9FIRM
MKEIEDDLRGTDGMIDEIVMEALKRNTSDIHITVGLPPVLRVHGKLTHYGNKVLGPRDTVAIIKEMISENEFKKFLSKGELDTAYSHKGLVRFRLNVYKQRGNCAVAMRTVSDTIPTMEELKLPPILKELCKKKRGLILVTGPTGSGKSTTLAAMVDHMNQFRGEHIITIEDPIEYLHRHKNSMVNQRELGKDTLSFGNALRAALREDPDIILVGEMRDLDTIATALTAAETGHLVMSTLHTIGAAKTIDRVIDVFPPHQQQQVRTQLSSVLEAVISQQLMPRSDQTGRIVSLEIMTATPAIRNLIREGKTHQIQTIIQTNAAAGMKTMDSWLTDLYKQGKIDKETFIKYAVDYDEVKKFL